MWKCVSLIDKVESESKSDRCAEIPTQTNRRRIRRNGKSPKNVVLLWLNAKRETRRRMSVQGDRDGFI
jgi:hypothetical protein